MEALKTESVRDLESLDKILTSEEAVSMPSDAGEEPKLNNLSEEVDSIKRAEVKEESGATMRAENYTTPPRPDYQSVMTPWLTEDDL